MNNFKPTTLRNSNFTESLLSKYRKQKLNGVSETHLLDEVGDYHGVQHEKYVYETDGVNTKITSPHITNQTVTSSKGTAYITVVVGELQISAGWVTEIELSDGTLYRCEEQQGTIAYDASGNGNHGSLINNITHSAKRDNTLINYTNEFGYSNNSGTIVPRVVNSNLDALGNNCEFKGKVAADAKFISSNCINSDGISVEGTFNFDTTGLTITSKQGTADVAFDNVNNKIIIGSGTLYNLVLSNGYHFPLAEGLGTRSYRALDHEKYITWSNITWNTQDNYHYNITQGFTEDKGVKLPLKGLTKVEDYPWTWIFGNGGTGFYGDWKGDWFLPSNNGTIEVGDVIDYENITSISLTSQSLTTDFTNTLLSKFTNLVNLDLRVNNITLIDLTSCIKLTSFEIYNNDITGNLDFSNCSELVVCRVYNNDITGNLDFSNCPNMLTIDFRNNQVSNFDISNSNLLKDLRASNNNLSGSYSFNLSSLEFLYIDNNDITDDLDVSNCTSLTRLFCYGNDITSINFLNCNNLVLIRGYNNSNLSTIQNLSSNSLTAIELHNCNLPSINLSNCPSINRLYLYNNQLTSLDLSSNPLLTNVRIANNQLDSNVNSQMLIDLDAHGLSNGYFNSSIFGGSTLTIAGLFAMNSLRAKGWEVLGLGV